jgi:hypothetical protein
MKSLLFFLLFLIPLAVWADDVNEYKASNGVVYHVNDTLRLGHGTRPDGGFATARLGGMNAFMIKSHSHDGEKDDRLFVSRGGEAALARIRRIKKEVIDGVDKYTLVINIPRTPGNFELDIESAIKNCEVAICTGTRPGMVAQVVPDKFDQLKKLKELLDNGTLTKEEFETQKKKLLN